MQRPRWFAVSATLATAAAFAAACASSQERTPLDPPGDPAPESPAGDLAPPTSCEGLRCDVPKCGGGATTAIEGDIYDPAGKTKLYNVLAYVPNADLAPLAPSVSCERCGEVSGDPIAAGLSDEKGHFRIEGVPAGDDVPVVLQVGKWRRRITVPHVEACQTTLVADREARLPGRAEEGDLPRIAVVTGGFDELGCLLTRIGVHATEYAPPTNANAHVHVYRGIGGGDYTLGGAPAATELWKDAATLSRYDMVLLACEGWEYDEQDSHGNKTAADKQAMHDYLGKGGRVFATHYHYTWFKESPDAVLRDVASWNEPVSAYGHEALSVDTSFPKGAAFASWLTAVGASKEPGKLEVDNPAANVASVNGAVAQRWLYGQKGVSYMSFNTPVGAPEAQQCGRAVLSDVHVSGEAGSKLVPNACDTASLTPQELALEFLLFDLSACVQPDGVAPKPPVVK